MKSDHQADRWWRRLGPRPACFGEFERGATRCEGGIAPCPFHVACATVVDYGRKHHLKAKEFVAPLPDLVLRDLCWGMMRDPATRLPPSNRGHMVLWAKFWQAFKDNVPASLYVSEAGQDSVVVGDLYLDRPKKLQGHNTGVRLNMKTPGLRHARIFHYYPPGPRSQASTLYFRADLQQVLKLYPEVLEWGCEWDTNLSDRSNHNTGKLKTFVRRIQPRYIQRIGRLVSLMMVKGELLDFPWPIEVSDAKSPSRRYGNKRT